MVPLCRLIPTDAVRPAFGDASWLVPLFDQAGYVPTMGIFTIVLKGRHGETKNVTCEMVERWDPIWQQLNASFEIKLVREWTDLQHKAFFVWDGNQRLKTWMKRIEEGMERWQIEPDFMRQQHELAPEVEEATLVASLKTLKTKLKKSQQKAMEVVDSEATVRNKTIEVLASMEMMRESNQAELSM
ncbi:hypothetical protein L7F22_041078 [Adiantum nelumboides]|nr:hypothetical protein [Adiantum nelumboides]